MFVLPELNLVLHKSEQIFLSHWDCWGRGKGCVESGGKSMPCHAGLWEMEGPHLFSRSLTMPPHKQRIAERLVSDLLSPGFRASCAFL